MTTLTSREQIRATILAVLGGIAPEVEPDSIDPEIDLRDQLDIDSMDFLNLVIGVHKRLGVDIPEAHYPRLTTLNGFVDYVDTAISSAT
jgi:acyl carrier protein